MYCQNYAIKIILFIFYCKFLSFLFLHFMNLSISLSAYVSICLSYYILNYILCCFSSFFLLVTYTTNFSFLNFLLSQGLPGGHLPHITDPKGFSKMAVDFLLHIGLPADIANLQIHTQMYGDI